MHGGFPPLGRFSLRSMREPPWPEEEARTPPRLRYITISYLSTYGHHLEPQDLRQEGIRQRPHVGALLVVGGAAVAALGVLPI